MLWRTRVGGENRKGKREENVSWQIIKTNFKKLIRVGNFKVAFAFRVSLLQNNTHEHHLCLYHNH